MFIMTKFEKVRFQLHLKTFYGDYLTIDKEGRKYLIKRVFTNDVITEYKKLDDIIKDYQLNIKNNRRDYYNI